MVAEVEVELELERLKYENEELGRPVYRLFSENPLQCLLMKEEERR